LAEIRAGDRRGRDEAKLAIRPAGKLRANLDAIQYNIFTLENLFHRSGVFTESAAEDPVTWSFEWNPILTEPGSFVISRKNDPLPDGYIRVLLGPNASPVTKIEGGWRFDGARRRLLLSDVHAGAKAGLKSAEVVVEPAKDACLRIGPVPLWPDAPE
jgi:hypothetical protein